MYSSLPARPAQRATPSPCPVLLPLQPGNHRSITNHTVLTPRLAFPCCFLWKGCTSLLAALEPSSHPANHSHSGRSNSHAFFLRLYQVIKSLFPAFISILPVLSKYIFATFIRAHISWFFKVFSCLAPRVGREVSGASSGERKGWEQDLGWPNSFVS